MTTQAIYTLPDLSDEYTINEAQIRSYQKNGHVMLKNVASTEEVAAYGPAIEEVVNEIKAEARAGAYQKSLAERDTYHKAFIQVDGLYRRDERVRKFVLARRFGKIAADLMGVDGVRVYLDQALFKEPGGGHTPWHQDQFYWPLDTQKTITMWMPLVDLGIENGTLAFGDGTHEMGPLSPLAISDQSDQYYKDVIRERNIPTTIYELHAGDATWHGGWTVHKAPGNVIDMMRKVITVVFYADGTRVLEPQNEKHTRELGKWLGNRQPGELADAYSNPLVYSRR